MASPALDAKVRAHARLVNEALHAVLPDVGGPAPAVFDVRGPMRHVVAAGGKRIRPILCLLAHEAAGGRAEDALPTAVGIELLHTFTLVHDDIMDRSPVRRGHPTVGALWGDEVAITVGDGLFALAFDAFTRNGEVAGMDPRRALAVCRRASAVCLDLAQGQALDVLHAQRDDVTVAEHLEMIRLKTGVLLEFSLAAGAMLAGAPRPFVDAIARFGAPLGVAFQIRDDLLDLTGEPGRTGKPLGGDVRMGKRTLMVAHAFEHSRERERLAGILGREPDETSEKDVEDAIRILREAGSLDFAHAEAERRLDEAKAALRGLPPHAGLDTLAKLADYVLHRDG